MRTAPTFRFRTTRGIAAVAVVALLGGVLGATASEAAAEDAGVVFIDDNVQSMARVGSSLYYSTITGCAGDGVEFPPTCEIKHAIAGLDPTDPDQRTVHDWRTRVVSNLATDERSVYWVHDDGRIIRGTRGNWDGGGTQNFLADKEDPSTASQITVDDEWVYWTENRSDSGKLFRAPVNRGPRELVYASGDSTIRAIQADGRGGVLFTANTCGGFGICFPDVLHRVAPDGAGGFSVTTSDHVQVDSLAVDASSVYYITRVGADGDPGLFFAPFHDLRNPGLLARLDGAGDPRWPVMVADGDAVYFHESRAGSGPLFRLRLTAEAVPQAMSADVSTARELALGYGHLFVNTGGQVLRYPVGATRTLDLVGDAVDLEVVQSIQNAAHDVPLIAGKPTFVRMHANIGESNPAVSELRVWPAAQLHGTRDSVTDARDGTPLPGSPLLPVDPLPLTDDPIDRATADNSVVFELPESWAEGTITLTSVVNPSRSTVETDYVNNETSRTVTFHETRGICLDMLPVLTHAGTSVSGWSPSILSHFARAKSVLPTAGFGGNFAGGTPRTIPLANEPYNMRDRDHKNMLMMNLTVEFMFSSPPANCGDWHTIRTALVPDSNNFGMSNRLAPTIYALRDFRANPIWNFPRGGMKGLAHEVGHQLGFAHVHCPGPGMDREPGWPYESYPYDPCTLDDSNDHIGFDPLTRSVIAPYDEDGNPAVTDYNSYGHPNWTSDYSYRKAYRQLQPDADAPTPTGGSGASTASEGTDGRDAVVIGGWVDPTGEAFLSHGYEAPAEVADEIRASIAERTEPSADHELHLYAADGTLLTSAALDAANIDTDSDDEALVFLHILEPDVAAVVARAEVVEVADGATLATRAAGVQPPAVTIDEPSASDVVGDAMTVRWTATDPDDDELSLLVRYSNDGGATWSVLDNHVTGGELIVDMSTMPGGDEAFVQVIASDGLHSTTDTVGPFVVTTHAPLAQIMTDDFAPLDTVDTATAGQAEAVRLRGYGYDAEDGELTGAALSWQVDGPVLRFGNGDAFQASDLPPGTYAVTLTAMDSDGQTAIAETTLEIAPKLIREGSSPTLDGECDPGVYDQDPDPMVIRGDDGEVAEARFVHADGDLYACLTGLPTTGGVTETVTLKVDTDADGGATEDAGDLFFRVRNDDAWQTGHADESGGEVADPEPNGLVTAVGFGDASWTAELRITGDRLGGWERVVRMWAAHESGDGAVMAWPSESTATGPGTWGLTALGDGNDPPTLRVAASAVTVDEGALATNSGTVLEPEGDAVTLTASIGTVEANGDGTWSWSWKTTDGPADSQTVTVTASDDHGLESTVSFELQVDNVAPTTTIDPEQVTVIDEGGTVTVTAAFSDPGIADEHTATIDWGVPDGLDGEELLAPSVEITQAGGPGQDRQGIVTGVYAYGDDDAGDGFPISVTVTDTDAASGTDGVSLTVDNVAPTVVIEDGDGVTLDGVATRVATAGDMVDFTATGTDPGSDDLRLDWAYGDGGTDTSTSLVNPPGADPLTSPTVQPREVTDQMTHTFADACLYPVTFTATDDDGGSGEHTMAVIVAGTADTARGSGYWRSQYGSVVRLDLSRETLQCYLEVVNHASEVFSEHRLLATFDDAVDILGSKGPDADELLEVQLLAAWLNFANGAYALDEQVDTDDDGIADTAYGQVLADAETVRTDPDRTRRDLLATKDVLDRLNNP